LPCYPAKFKPIFKERIWGSDRLKTLFGKDLPPHTKIGESWELADLPDDCSQITDGPWNGMTLRQLLTVHGQEFGFTPDQCRPPFGLLIKFLDANDVLSVQVHPDADACKLFPDARLKTECWYVLAAEPGSVIYRGLKPGIDRKQVENAVKVGNLQDLMMLYPAKAGDFHYLPAGTVHALGAGVVVAEIQTPSDTTYRLYDWNRRDAHGNSRELHIEQALASIHYPDVGATSCGRPDNVGAIPCDRHENMTPPPPTGSTTRKPESGTRPITPPTGPTSNPPTETTPTIRYPLSAGFSKIGKLDILLDCPFFNVGLLQNSDKIQADFELSQPTVLISLSCTGSVTNRDALDYACQFQPGDTILLPAIQGKLDIHQPGQCLLTCLGPEKS
jgi:mannose-6-phosphate isomerase class I